MVPKAVIECGLWLYKRPPFAQPKTVFCTAKMYQFLHIRTSANDNTLADRLLRLHTRICVIYRNYLLFYNIAKIRLYVKSRCSFVSQISDKTLSA